MESRPYFQLFPLNFLGALHNAEQTAVSLSGQFDRDTSRSKWLCLFLLLDLPVLELSWFIKSAVNNTPNVYSCIYTDGRNQRGALPYAEICKVVGPQVRDTKRFTLHSG